MANNIKTEVVTVAATATEIVAANYNRKRLFIRNESGSTIYIDDPDTDTTTNSFPLADGKDLDLLDYQGALWGIVAAGTADISVMEFEY